MSDGTLPNPGAASAPATALSSWKLHLAAAIGAFFLGLTDYVRHGTSSTVVLLNDALTPLTAELSLVPVILLTIPILGVIAAWIFRPSTEREAFALGFAVFSVFALAPEETPKVQAAKTTIQVSSAPTETGFLMIGAAYAGEIASQDGSATVVLQYDGAPPAGTEVSVSNLTGGQRLGKYWVQDSLTLVGKPGDRLQLAFEAPGYERAAIELTLEEFANSYTVELQESGTPLFIQRLTGAARAVAMPSGDPASTTMDTGAAAAAQ